MVDQPVAPRQHAPPGPFWGPSVRWRIVAGNVAILLLALVAIGLTFWQLSRLLLAVETLETASNRVRIATDVRHASTGLLSDVSRLLPVQDSELFAAEIGDALVRLEDSQAAMGTLIEQTEDPQTLNALHSVSDRVQNIINVTGTMVRQAEGEQWPSVRVRVGVLNRDQQQVVNEVNNLVEQVRALEAEALTRVAAARRAAILYPAVVGLFALGLAAVSITRITRSIAGPVERLTAGADRLATGAFDERVRIERHDELGRLALAFNQMAERLQTYYAVLEERVAERTRDLALSAEVGRRLSQVRALDALVQEAVERIRERFDLYYVQLYLTDDSGQTLRLLAGTGEIGAELVERGHRLPIDFTSINGIAAREKEALVIPNTRESDLFRPNPLLPETRSEMAVPLLVGTDVIGVLDLQSRHEDELSAEILPAFEVLAGQLAIAVGNARLFEEVNQARAELATLNRIVTDIGSTLDLQESLQIVVSELVAHTSGNQARVALLNESGTALTIVAEELDPQHDTGTALGVQIPVAGNILTQEVLETREPVLIVDPQHDPRLAPMHELFRQQGIETMILLPILAANEVIGTVGIDILEPDHFFTEEQERLAAAIVLQTATAIQNARLFEEIQERVAETRALYETSRAINISQNYEEILEVLRTYSFLGEAHHLSLNYFDRPWTETQRPETVQVLARSTDLPSHLLRSVYDFGAFPGVEPLRQQGTIVVEDVSNDTLIDETLRRLLQVMQGASALFVPLVAGGQMLGFVLAVYRQPTTFRQGDVNGVSALTGQAAVAIHGLQLLQQAQKRARHERILREVTASVRSVTDVELILKTAAREVGQALGRETFVYLGDGDNGSSTESSVPETSTSPLGEERV